MADEVYVADRAALRAWLDAAGDRDSGIWLVYDKGPNRSLRYDDIVEEALCFGWVDSKPRTVDDHRTALWLAPRRPGSRWSAKNKERVERLTAAGLMTARGLEVVAAARASGTWNALDEVETGAEPADLTAALDAVPDARLQWNDFPRSARRAILEWISSAKKPETRRARIERTVSDAAQGIRANQWRQPSGH